MKEYTFEIKVVEGHDEYWEELRQRKEYGCEEIEHAIKNAIETGDLTMGLQFEIKLIKFIDL